MCVGGYSTGPTGPLSDPRSTSHLPPSSGRGFLGSRRRPRAAGSKGDQGHKGVVSRLHIWGVGGLKPQVSHESLEAQVPF